jgi:hypothetical protein
MNAMSRRFRLSWPLLVGALAFIPALRAPKGVLGDPDTYFHVVVGRWIMAHGALPTVDPFSHTLAGAAWRTHEWLGEVVLAILYGLGGWRALVLLTASCFAISAALLTRRLLRQSEPLLAVTLSLIAINLFLPHLLVRPHVLVLPILIAFCGALFAARDEGRGPPWRALPLILLWANIHGSFAFGLGLAVYLGLEAVAKPSPGQRRIGEARRWALFVLAAAALTLATPNGIGGYVPVIHMMEVPIAQTYIAEWQSTNFGHFDPLELWLLGPILLGFSTGIRLPVSRLLLVLALIHLALVHTRHADLVAFVAPLAVVGALGPQLAERMHRGGLSRVGEAIARLAPPVPWPTIAAASVAGLLLAYVEMPRPIERANDVITPTAALDAAQRLGLKGPVFNSQAFGGYLIFRGVPVFGDGRLEMYGNDFLTEYFAASSGKEPALSDLLDRYHVTWALLLPGEGAVAELDHRPGWHRIYSDKWAVVLARADAGGP